VRSRPGVRRHGSKGAKRHLKDPLGVLRGFTRHVEDGLGAHLMLAGPAADSVSDDPESEAVLGEVCRAPQELPPAERERAHVVCLSMDDMEENGAVVNALQRRADVIVQKSLAEGFGLTPRSWSWSSGWRADPMIHRGLTLGFAWPPGAVPRDLALEPPDPPAPAGNRASTARGLRSRAHAEPRSARYTRGWPRGDSLARPVSDSLGDLGGTWCGFW
jgi:hypothetical protein